MEEKPTLEEIRKICSDYIRNNLGEEYDMTKWMDKFQLYSIYRDVCKIKGENYGSEICNFRQNE